MGKSANSNESLDALVQQMRSAKSPSAQMLKSIHDVYAKNLALADLKQVLAHVRELDTAGYLEDVLWPHVALATDSRTTSDADRQQQKAWVLSVMMLVNFKFRESAENVWGFISGDSDGESSSGEAQWEAFVAALLALKHGASAIEWSVLEKSHLVQFLINCYQSLEVPVIAKTFLKLTSLPTWSTLSATQRQIEFQQYPKLERHWKNVIGSEADEAATADGGSGEVKPAKRRKTAASKQQQKPQSGASTHERSFMADLIHEFLELIRKPVKATKGSEIDHKLLYMALFLAFVTDLLSQLPTRRFLQVVLRRAHFLMAVRQSPLVEQCLQWRSQFEITALKKQIALADASMRFPIDSHTGKSFTAKEQRELASKHIQMLQHWAFQAFRNTPLEELAIIPVSSIADRKSFTSHLKPLVDAERAQVEALAVKLGVLSGSDEASTLSNKELLECFVDEYSSTESLGEWTETPVFPTEFDIWNDLLESKDTSSAVYGADDAKLLPLLPIRKLSLQFLNVGDYLQRNYELFRLEAASDIRSNLELTIKQLDAVRSLTSPTAETVFRGHSQMATPLSSPFKIMKIAKPALGKTRPASVIGQFDVELDSRHDFKTFDAFQPKELVFLVTLRATNDEAAEAMGFTKNGGQDADEGLYFPEQYGVLYVRGAEVIEVVDSYGAVLTEENPAGKGRKRTLKVALDGLQYKRDLDEGHLDAYQQVNVLVRRKPRENNFKAVLDTVLGAWDNAKREELLPSWLHDLFLGYGDPSAATFKSICKQRQQKEVRVPLLDLVADADHVLETCFENDDETCFIDADDSKKPLAAKDAVGSFTFVQDLQKDGQSVVVEAHRKSSKDHVHNGIAPSPIRFTKSQVAAVRSGMCEGLTMIVGPPGTGKTDVAVQLVLNLHRTTPSSEKILIVAHSNQALNDFFSKILSRKLINEAEIVRLGQGQRAESTSEEQSSSFHDDFSRNGRVNFLLQRRLDLLKEVEFMAKWLEEKDPNQYSGLSGSAGYSCENALFFYQFHVRPLLDAARIDTTTTGATKSVDDDALLKAYFTSRNGAAPESREKLLELVTTVDSYFGELHRLQPFELLQTPKQRGDLYLIQHARIVAMTCTHAALNQRKLVDLGLTFGSLIMEEAGQVSEVDTLIPLLLAASSSSSSAKQEQSGSGMNLKRVVLMGDPHQLPPVVKSLALKNYAHLDQSLFTRLLRLDVPRIVLDQQGRSRSMLADLYRWKYAAAAHNADNQQQQQQLRDLPRVADAAEFQAPNAGFAHVAQLIDVPSGRERQVRAFAYENEEEARFVVALAKFMLAIGYKAEKITILTTYNAQKELLQRLLRRSSSNNETSSLSKSLQKCKVSTVDRFQGQQNDFILLSTVRSGASVGHLLDVRRACTAFSRARLGLYVFGNETTLRKSKELEPFVSRLLQIVPDQSTQLALIPSERFGGELKRDEQPLKSKKTKSAAATTKSSGSDAVVQLKKMNGAVQLEAIVADVLKTASKRQDNGAEQPSAGTRGVVRARGRCQQRALDRRLCAAANNALSTADCVRLPTDADVDDFRDAVKSKYADSHLAGIAASDLLVYADQAAVNDPNQLPLEEDSSIGDQGGAKRSALAVVVPTRREDVLLPPARSSFEATKQAIREAMRELEQERRPVYAMSALTSEQHTRMLRKLKVQEEVLDLKEPQDTSVPGFQWDSATQDLGDEHKETQRACYLDYLCCHLMNLLDTKRFHLKDISNDKDLLSIADPRLPFRLNGTADTLLISGEVIHLKKLVGVCLVMEIKKKVDKSHVPQAHAQLVSASLKAPVGCYPMSLLTDLNATWHFSWFNEEHLLTQVTLKYPKNAFDFIKAAVANKDGRVPFYVPFTENGQRPLKRLRLDDFVPLP